ncbi:MULTISPECIES: DUF2891 domain-containing protein [Sphingobium]|jgi:hypothetical protein|uniref:DUF2891 domain-containing protein n=1 Tax=Sphingobium TaxID=165695 RepID=UPI000DBBADB5|nr:MULTISPECIES: DUF2891 domain-containing protein [Sphingobium]KAA9019374.1 DUF2891 domain-containing protein [Sphingobium limneticum]MBU0933119.1 DUF2891 domain-containing protein [Alphaproteobacteria bacterium]BBD01730.1 hypothetical protein YGS_C1P2985 [Sphingobium sp. YG1]
MTLLTQEIGENFATLTLSHLGRQYPYKMDLVMAGPQDARPPQDHHPIFHGSFDWHSCVHGWWQVMRLKRLFPTLAQGDAIRARGDAMLVPDKVAGELAYLHRPLSTGFERPYGWAWALALHQELALHDAPWADAFAPLADAFAERFHAFLPKLTYPLRVGTHFNIAFALILTLGWAEARDPALVALIRDRAIGWFGQDRACQAWEPGGDEFLSPALCEALLMSRLLDRADFADWFHAFLPHLSAGEPVTLFTPATVSDRSDGKIAHLDGLNLSRAWCWRGIAAALGTGDPVADLAERAARVHIDASLPHVAGDYMGEHWLATFALLALE